MEHTAHNNSNIHHAKWQFRPQAFIAEGPLPVLPNILPLGRELREWLLRKGKINVLCEPHKLEPGAPTNPHSYDASVLSMHYADCINEAANFSNGSEEIDPLDAETRRARILSEQYILEARVLESLLKQLLHCTAIPEKLYKKSTLHALLLHDCKDCRVGGRPTHQVSLLGSLAHRYGLCIEVDGCLMDDIKKVNKRRNATAAHAGTLTFNPITSQASRDALREQSIESSQEFVHMLKHIADIEESMIGELQEAIAAGCGSQWWIKENLCKAPDSPETSGQKDAGV